MEAPVKKLPGAGGFAPQSEEDDPLMAAMQHFVLPDGSVDADKVHLNLSLNPDLRGQAAAAMSDPSTRDTVRGAFAMGMPQSQSEFEKSNPTVMPSRPVLDKDSKVSAWRGAGLGLADFANHMGGGRSEFLQGAINRQHQDEDAIKEYDRTAPANKQAVSDQRYGKYVNDANVSSEIGSRTLAAQQQAQARKAAFLSTIEERVKAGTESPDAIRRSAMRIAGANGITVAPEELDGLLSEKPVGAQFTVIKGENGRPEGLQDKQGRVYTPSQIGKIADPNALNLWNDAVSGHEQVRREKREDQNASDDRQAAGFAHADEAAVKRISAEDHKKGRDESLKHLTSIRDAQGQLDLIKQLGANPSPTNQNSLVFKMLGIDLPEGIHRISDSEINSIKAQGSLSQRAEATLRNWKQGDVFAPEIVTDMMNTAREIARNKVKTANSKLRDNTRVFGYRDPAADEDGAFGAIEKELSGEGASKNNKLADFMKKNNK